MKQLFVGPFASIEPLKGVSGEVSIRPMASIDPNGFSPFAVSNERDECIEPFL